MEFNIRLKLLGRVMGCFYEPKPKKEGELEKKQLPAEPHSSFGFGGFSAEVHSSEYYDDKQVVLWSDNGD